MVKQRINAEVKVSVLIEPMNNALGISPSKGNQGYLWVQLALKLTLQSYM